MDDLYRKREEMVVRIRKSAKQQQILKRRQLLYKAVADYTQKLNKTHQDLLNDRQKLQNLGIHLRGQPNLEWDSIFREIGEVIEGHEDFGQLVEIGILKQIALVFKPQFLHLKLTRVAAVLLNSIIFQSKQTTTPIARMLSEYGLIQDLLQSIMSCESLEDFLEELHLAGNMVGQNGFIRNQFVHHGWLHMLILLHKNRKTASIQLRNLIIWLIANTVLYYDQAQFSPKFNIGNILTELLLEYLSQEFESKHKVIAIGGLINLIRWKQDSVLNIFRKNTKIINILMNMIKGNDENLKVSIWKLFKYLIKNKDPSFYTEILRQGLLDIVDNTFQSKPNYQHRDLIQKILIKMILVSKKVVEAIISHSIFVRMIQACHISVEEKLRLNNLRLIAIIIGNIQIYQLENIFRNSTLLELIIENIDQTYSSPDIMTLSLSILRSLVQTYDSAFTPSGKNKIILKLENRYKISSKIQHLAVNNENKQIQNLASSILDAIVHLHYGDESNYQV